MKKLFTSESVTPGHPDKLCDQISDAILDSYLRLDKKSRVAVEVCAHKNGVLVTGEVTSKGKVDIEKVVRDTIIDIGYSSDNLKFNGNNIKIDIDISKQSPDIAIGVDSSYDLKDIGWLDYNNASL
jgi:S-adenosylmethionine synthetase